MTDHVAALIRTVVPIIAGATLTALANFARRELGLDIDVAPETKAAIITTITAIVSGAWYLAFSSLERKWPAFGVFLGLMARPHYGLERPIPAQSQPSSAAVEAPSDAGASEGPKRASG